MKDKRSMRRGIVGLLSIICLLLLSSYVYADDSECGCNQCHGNPPVVSTVGGPYGLAGVGFTSGAHLAHSNGTFNRAQISICYVCHFNGMPFTPLCGNNLLQIGFNINGTVGAGTVYDGSVSLNSPWTYEGTNGTLITTGGSMTCSTTYCHSNGTGGTQNINASGVPPLNDPRPVAANSSPQWTASGPLACTSCHGYPPSYPQDQPKSNSHLVGQNPGDNHRQPCNFCHYPTTTDGVTITNEANHHNGIYNVAPDPAATYLGQPVSFTYAYDSGGGKCFTISCHGGTDLYWGKVSILATITQNSGPVCFETLLSTSYSGGTAPYSCSWDLGDNTSSQVCSVDHLYQSAGPFTVTLSGRDANNHPYSQMASITPQAVNQPPAVNESISISCSTVTLTDLSTDSDYNTCGHSGNGNVTISWGDSSSTPRSVFLSTSPSNSVFTKTYATASTFTILHTVTDNAGAISTKNITGIKVPATYTISGQVTHPAGHLSGVTMILKKGVSTQGVATTDANGNYSFAPQGCGTYTVTANRSGFTFDGDPLTGGNQNPVTVAIAGTNLTVNFTATP